MLGTKKPCFGNAKTWHLFTQAKHQPCTASYRAGSENTGLILTPCIFCLLSKRHIYSGLTPPMFSKLHKSKTPCFLAPNFIGYKMSVGKTAQKPRHPTPVSVKLSFVFKHRGEKHYPQNGTKGVKIVNKKNSPQKPNNT
jgi:hypothetical protein